MDWSFFMSKKKLKLLKGRFYSIFTTGGSHPSLLFRKNKRKNKYYIVVFDSSNGRHRTRLRYPTSKEVKESYVQNRPLLSVRKDLGNHELFGLRIHKEDKVMIEIVKHRKPRMTKNYKKRFEK